MSAESTVPTRAATRPLLAAPLLRTGKRIAIALGLLLVVLAPFGGASGYTTRTIMLIGILSLMTSGLNIVLGYAGELAVAQVFLYAAGAYVASYLGVEHGIDDVLVVIPCVVVAAVLIGLLSGIPGLRLGGWSLAMVSFFMVLTIPSWIMVLKKFTNGPLGQSPPVPKVAGQTLTQNGIYVLIVVTVLLWFLIARNLILSRHGNAFLVLRQSPILASSVGISVFRMKLIVYVLGAVPCAVAGALFAWLDGFVSPDTFTFSLALSVLAASVFGGARSIYGAVLGAAILQYGQQSLTSFQDWELIVYGIFLIAAALILKDGLAGLLRQGVDLLRAHNIVPTMRHVVDPVESTDAPRTLPGERLVVSAVSKSFGGLQALREVDLHADAGKITALIGPNGSGKTTLLNIVCGYYSPSSGMVSVGSTSLAGVPSYRVARAGLARTFQTPMVTHGMSTLDFVSTGRYVGHASSMVASVLRLPSFRRATTRDDAESMRLLHLLGIAEVADTAVDALPLGTRRLAEVARTMSSSAGVYLFDEVASGLDAADLDRLKDAIRVIRDAGGTVVLVEHNFPLVLELSDTIHVLSRGSLLASGTPEEIQADPRVLAEYVGGSRAGAELQTVKED